MFWVVVLFYLMVILVQVLMSDNKLKVAPKNKAIYGGKTGYIVINSNAPVICMPTPWGLGYLAI